MPRTPPKTGRKEAASNAPGPGGVSAKQPKAGQRERLVTAMIELSAQRSYPSVSVADVSSHAGVSSATFYEQFEDKEDCLLAAYRQAAAHVLSRTEPLTGEEDWRQASRTVLVRLLEALESDPDGGRLLLVEALAGGPRVRAERERVLGAFEQRAQEFLDAGAGNGASLDLPAGALLAAVRSIVSHDLRTHNEDRLGILVEDLLAWLESYSTPTGTAHWSTGPHTRLPANLARKWTKAAAELAPAPERLPRGRHRLPAAAVARSQRMRIIQGTAEVIVTKGYAEATVTDIVAAAGISRDVFYAHFASKQDAYLGAQQFGTQDLFEACSAAYFSGRSWPERVWFALQALVVAIASNPELSHLRIVECYAAGPAAIEQTEQLKRAATIFLQEGYTLGAQASRLPRLCSHAITGAVFEIFYGHASRGELAELPRQLPLLAYIAIAPFVGPKKAIEAVERMRSTALGGGS